jgi:hypothetical protein
MHEAEAVPMPLDRPLEDGVWYLAAGMKCNGQEVKCFRRHNDGADLDLDYGDRVWAYQDLVVCAYGCHDEGAVTSSVAYKQREPRPGG